MERLLLSKEMGISSNRIDSAIHDQEVITGEGDSLVGVDGQMNGFGPTNIFSEERNMPVAAFSSGWNGTELDVANNYKANPGSSSPLHGGAEWRVRSTVPPASPISPDGDVQATHIAGLGYEEGLLHGRGKNTGEVPQASGALVVGPEIGEWDGSAGGAEDKNGVAAEDWLDVAHALMVADR